MTMRLIRTITAALLVVTGAALPAGCRGAGTPATAQKDRPVVLQPIAGSTVKKVILTQKASQRLDVQTGEIRDETIVPTQLVGGIVVDPSAGGGDTPGQLWVRVALSPPEWERLAKDRAARILPLETRPALAKELTGRPAGKEPQEAVKSGMLSVFYVLPAGSGGLAMGDRVRVELQASGTGARQKIVPYSAVYYDAKGDAWVYVSTAPLTFVRQRISVERVTADRAVLTDGPPAGTKVATVGVSLLYGAEVFGK